MELQIFSGNIPGTPVFTHYTTARRWCAPHDLVKKNDSKIERVTAMGIKKKSLDGLFQFFLDFEGFHHFICSRKSPFKIVTGNSKYPSASSGIFLCQKIFYICSQPPDNPKLVQYARKIDLKSSPFGQLMSGEVYATRHTRILNLTLKV